MNTKPIILIVFAMLLLSACGGKKGHHTTSAQLIEDVQKFGIDSIEVTAGDTLVGTTVDQVLRHYPELYHATEKAKESYVQWTELAKNAKLKINPNVIDIAVILEESFFDTKAVDADSAWQYLTTIDSLYIQALVSVPSSNADTDQQKSAIGRTRKAWQAYTKQLQRMTAIVPENCRERYLSIIKHKTRQLSDDKLYKQN